MRRLSSLEIRSLRVDPKSAKMIARLQRQIYPSGMQEDDSVARAMLASSDLSLGIFKNGEMIGYALVQGSEKGGSIYLYDIAVLPQYQRKGYGSRLAKELLAAARARNLKIHMHVRTAGYALFGDPGKVREMGYQIVKDQLRPDWYFLEFGIHEDARELFLEPTAESPIASKRATE